MGEQLVMTQLDQSLVEDLRSEAERALRELGVVREVLRVFRVYEKPYSVTLFLEASDGGSRYVVKKHRPHPTNAHVLNDGDQTAIEYEVLALLYQAYEGCSSYGVPRPFAVLPDCDAFVMEYVKGHTLDEHMGGLRFFASNQSLNQLTEQFFHIGQWLKRFQDVTHCEPAGAKATSWIRLRAQSRLDLIEEHASRQLPKNFCRLVSEFMDRQISRINDGDLVRCGRHGDFGPWNMISGENRITVIDFFGYQHDSIAIDILKLLVFLDELRVGPVTSGRRLLKLRSAFLAGYGPLPRIPQPVALACEAMHRVCNLAGIVLRKDMNLRRKYKSAICLRRHVHWLHNANEDTKSLLCFD